MQRDSDSDANPSGAQEDDQMLKPKDGKKPKKKKSKPPVIVPANGGDGGRVSVVVPPAGVKKNQVFKNVFKSSNVEKGWCPMFHFWLGTDYPWLQRPFFIEPGLLLGTS